MKGIFLMPENSVHILVYKICTFHRMMFSEIFCLEINLPCSVLMMGDVSFNIFTLVARLVPGPTL